MKKFSYILLIFSFFVFLISLIGFFWGHKPLQTQTFYASMNISNENVMGIDVNSTALSFGRVSRGGSSARNIQIQNGFNFPIIVAIHADGDIRPLLNFENVVKIEKGESKKIGFSVSTFSDIKEGFYSGNVSFELYEQR